MCSGSYMFPKNVLRIWHRNCVAIAWRMVHILMAHVRLQRISLFWPSFRKWTRRESNTQPSDLESDALPLRHGSYIFNTLCCIYDTQIMRLGYYLFKTKSYVYHTKIMRQEFYLFKTMYYVYDMIIVCDGYYLFKRMCYLFENEIAIGRRTVRIIITQVRLQRTIASCTNIVVKLPKMNTTRIEHTQPSHLESYALPLCHWSYLFNMITKLCATYPTCSNQCNTYRKPKLGSQCKTNRRYCYGQSRPP